MISIAILIPLNISNALNEKRNKFKAEMYVFDETTNRIQYCATTCENEKKNTTNSRQFQVEFRHFEYLWYSAINREIISE